MEKPTDDIGPIAILISGKTVEHDDGTHSHHMQVLLNNTPCRMDSAKFAEDVTAFFAQYFNAVKIPMPGDDATRH